MNLTEPQCGTDLGLIKTRAEPRSDGSYSSTGTKIFISGGEHDMSENIIHLVLARTPGAPEGTKGISLFLVPRVMVNEDGSLGARNALNCGSIEHKMGLHGNCTCVMNYDGATGWIVGEENKGLAAMFIMMNQARLGVGLQGLAQAEVAYQNAARYAMERRQGRALTGAAEPDKPADTLFVHPDVRRMLMEGKAFTEGPARVAAVRRAAGRSRQVRAQRSGSGRTPTICSRCSPPSSRAMAQTRASTSRSCRSRCSAVMAISRRPASSSRCATRASP